MARTRFHVVKDWLLEALIQKGGRSGLHELIAYIETIKHDALLPDDHLPQKGHPKDTQFKYYCRWAITTLRDEGKIRRGSPRGVVELEDSMSASGEVTGKGETSEGPDRFPNGELGRILHDFTGASIMHEEEGIPKKPASSDLGHQPWLRQELAKVLPQNQWDEVPAHERERLLGELEGRLIVSNPDRDETWRRNMAKAILKRVQDIAAGRYPPVTAKNHGEVETPIVSAVAEANRGNPPPHPEREGEPYSLRKSLAQQIDFDLDHGLSHDKILAKADVWLSAKGARASAKQHLQSRIYRHLGGNKESSKPSIRYYEQAGGQLLEKYVREHYRPDVEYSRDEILAWFAEYYPLFKPNSLKCDIAKYTTNYRSRVHYNAGQEHDLLFRIDDDWNRLRLYRPGEDPIPIYGLDQAGDDFAEPGPGTTVNARIKAMITKGENYESILKAMLPVYAAKYGNEKPEQWIRDRVLAKIRYVERGLTHGGTGQQGGFLTGRHTPIERNRILLAHLSRFGELCQSEQKRLGITPDDILAWLDALLVARPHAMVVSSLFLWAAEVDPDPVRFTTRLAIRMTGEYLDRAAKEPVDGIEGYVWDHFGRWHLGQPHPGEARWQGYQSVPVVEPADLAASEKLDLFAHLPPLIIGELVRDSSFLNEQQTWSAQASMKGSLGPLSRQLNLGIRRPLFLSDFDLRLDGEGGVHLKSLPESEVLRRSYVIAGLPLCTAEEWQQNLRLSKDEIAERILDHPLFASIVQIEVHRITAGLSGEMAASLQRHPDLGFMLEISSGTSVPLWLACRTLLEDLNFWPATYSVKDAAWEAAVSHALVNLENLGVIESRGNEIHLSDQFASKIKAHPAHPQNRGEKSFRVRLAQYLEKVSRGAS